MTFSRFRRHFRVQISLCQRRESAATVFDKTPVVNIHRLKRFFYVAKLHKAGAAGKNQQKQQQRVNFNDVANAHTHTNPPSISPLPPHSASSSLFPLGRLLASLGRFFALHFVFDLDFPSSRFGFSLQDRADFLLQLLVL